MLNYLIIFPTKGNERELGQKKLKIMFSKIIIVFFQLDITSIIVMTKSWSVFLETPQKILDTFELIAQYLGQQSIVWYQLAIKHADSSVWVHTWVCQKFLTGWLLKA